MKINCLRYVLVTVVIMLVLESSAYAYIDPGTGSFILQGAIAVAFGILYYFKDKLIKIVKRIKLLFTINKNGNKNRK